MKVQISQWAKCILWKPPIVQTSLCSNVVVQRGRGLIKSYFMKWRNQGFGTILMLETFRKWNDLKKKTFCVITFFIIMAIQLTFDQFPIFSLAFSVKSGSPNSGRSTTFFFCLGQPLTIRKKYDKKIGQLQFC